MRILAVRGGNLASLVSLELELAKGPLARAGLFAITGPTGAGKSTVLDAMCLALFDRTPRLSQAGRGVVGEVGANDPRTLVRRGAPQAWAECDFVGGDGVSYRARWQVRRAHGKANGALQDQKLTLTDLRAQQNLGGTKTEVLAEIRKRLGLDFDQFRRSALLAQGDFAAFLAADPDARATLLERMTGAEIYTELSRRTYQRAAEEQLELAELEGALAQRSQLSDDDRTQLQATIARLEQALAGLATRRMHLADVARWEAGRVRLRERVLEADAHREQVGGVWTDAAPRLAELRRIDAVQVHRSALARADRGEAAAREAQQETVTASAVVDETAESLTALRSKEAEARQASASATAERERMATVWDRAQRLDSLLEDKHAARLHATREAEARRARHDALREQQEAAVAALRAAEALREGAERALIEGAPWAALAQGWASWRGVLEDLARVSNESAAAGRREAELGARGGELKRARDRSHAAWLELAGDAEQPSLDAVERDVDHASESVHELERWLQVEESGRALGEVVRQAQHEHEARRARLSPAEKRVTSSRSELNAVSERLDLDERALALLRAQRDLGSYRAQLTDGDPCPLCGALDHPLSVAAVVAMVDHTVEDLEQVVTSARASQVRLTQVHAHAEAEVQQLAAGLARVALEVTEADARLFAWRTQRATVKVPALSLEAAQERHRAALVRRTRTVEALELRRLLDEQSAALERQHTEVESLREAMVDHAARRERLQARLAGVLAGLPTWRDELARDATAFIERCERGVEAYVAQQGAVRRADAEAQRLRSAIDQHLARSDGEEELARQAESTLAALTETCVRLQAERDDVLALPVSESKRVVEDTLARAHAAWQAVDKRVAAHEQLHAERSRRLRELRAQRNALADEAAASQRDLSALLATLQLSRAELAAWLARDPEWAREEREALARLRDSVVSADRAADERKAALREHEAQEPPVGREGELSVDEIEAALRATSEQLEQHRYQLRTNDDARDAGRAMRPRIEAQRARWMRWDKLKEVMGGADGKPFRLYAQRVTLDALLLDANLQLAKLAPRYRLERVAQTNMDISVVDQDMGDERRSVNSLSGGESFLVSLALALALSSFSARETRIETLFIDEGFGALDAYTLDVALAALDVLQATGCQIGVISHVNALTEQVGARVELVRRPGGTSTLELR